MSPKPIALLAALWTVTGGIMGAGRAEASPTPTERPSLAIRRYALIIGVNEPAKRNLKPLRYADDDAVRTWELFAQLPGESVLFSVLDAQTQRIHRRAAEVAEVPTKAAILGRAEGLFAKIRADAKKGLATELYFVFSGHGSVDGDNDGALELADGQLTRRELYEGLIARSPAGFNHILVDACDSYFFVNARGEKAQLEALLRARAADYLAKDSLESHPNTGVLVSTSSAAESFEWSAIQAGVFSHLLRSALLGAGDADADGTISYAEAEAFVASASAKLRHAKAKIRVFARAPARNRQHPLFVPSAASDSALIISSGKSGRMSVEDERGVRYADFNKSAEQELRLALVSKDPANPQHARRYYLMTPDGEFPVEPKGQVALTDLTPQTPRTGARSGVSDALERDLLAVSYGPAFYEGWSAREVLVEGVREEVRARQGRPLRTASLVTGAGALIALGVGIAFSAAANTSFAEYQRATDAQDISAAQARTQQRDRAASIGYGSAGALGLTAVTLFFLDLVQRDDP